VHLPPAGLPSSSAFANPDISDSRALHLHSFASRAYQSSRHTSTSCLLHIVAAMPKFFCDYCDVYLTHDSMSVRKAHNSGRNHLRNVQAYYEQISSEQTQQVINSITDAYSAEGQANPLYAANLSGGYPGGPMAGGFPGGPPMPMPGGQSMCWMM
jgi:hypothetical protein